MSKWSELTDTELMIIRQGLAKGYADGEDVCGENPNAWKEYGSSEPTAALFIVQEITEELEKRGKAGPWRVGFAMGAYSGIPLLAKDRKHIALRWEEEK
ncbi:MAG: hypothetical protein LUE27_11010 [Clostridia bacterium]|nr:hypothetical protein [Clostridia bacterium]